MLNRMLAAAIRTAWLLGIGLCMSTVAWASPQKVALLGPAVQVAALKSGWQGRLPVWSEPADADVIITLGEDAFNAAARWSRPRLALDLPLTVLQQARSRQCECSGVLLYPDPLWQLKLVRQLLGGNKRVALVYPERDGWLEAHLTGKVPEGLTLSFHRIKDVQDLGQKLPLVLERNDVLLLQPSTELFNADSARFVLLSSYRLGRPVIGPDTGYVKAGSLASVFAPPANIFSAIHGQLDALAQDGHFKPPVFPEPDVIVNSHVAHSFDLDVPSTARLAERLGISHAEKTR